MKKNILQILLFATLLLAGCKGKDGDPGPAGATGATGTTGDKGTTGPNGTGFDAATRDGNIVLTLSGKRPDNVAFTSTQDFKYILDGGSPAEDANVTKDDATGTLYFYVARYLGAVDEHHNNNYVDLQFSVSSAGVVTPSYVEMGTAVIDGTKFFGVYEYSGDYSIVPTITGYSYDATTGHLKFNFSITFPSSNSTTYDLTVSGVANVTVYTPLNDVVSGN